MRTPLFRSRSIFRPQSVVRPLPVFILLLLLLLSSHSAASPWISVGLGGGGGIQGIYPHPQNPSVLYASADMVGLYRSEDGGDSWQHCGFRDGTQLMYLAFAPEDPDIIFLTVHDGVWRSLDRGDNWELIGDAATVGYEVPPGGGDAKNLMPMLATANHLFVGISTPETAWGRVSRLDRSTGLWQIIETGAQRAVREFLVQRDDLYCVSFDGIWHSSDDGLTWTETTTCRPPEAGLDCWWFNLAAEADTLFALAGLTTDGDIFPYAQLYRSDNLGASWDSLHSFSGFVPALGEIEASFHTPSKLLDVNTTTGTLMVARVGNSVGGFARSTDAGISWDVYNPDNGHLGRVDTSGQPFRRISAQGIGKITMLRAAPSTANWHMSGAGYTAKSSDDGFSWEHAVTGLLNTVTYVVGEDPDDPNWILAGQTDNELIYSTDQGENWTNFSLCAEGPDSVACWGGVVVSLVFDPHQPGQALALFAGGGGGYAGRGNGNRYLVRLWKDPFAFEILYHFADVADPNMPKANRNLLAISATNPNEFFLATQHKADDGAGGDYETGVLRSTDGGLSWATAELGLGIDGTGLPPLNSALANLVSDSWGSFYLSTGHNFGVGNGLYRWNGAANRWDSLTTLAAGERFLSGTLAVGPDPGQILISYGQNDIVSLTIRSVDDGQSWDTVFSSDSSYASSAAVAPWDGELLALGQVGLDIRRPDANYSPWVSRDGGSSWEKARDGLILPQFHGLAFGSSGRLWGGSAGGSVAWSDVESTAGIASSPGPILGAGSAPNPFRPGTEFRFQLARSSWAALSLYDLQGRELRRLWRGQLEGGHHRFAWDGRDERGSRLPNGIYLFRLEAEGQVRGEKAVLLN